MIAKRLCFKWRDEPNVQWGELSMTNSVFKAFLILALLLPNSWRCQCATNKNCLRLRCCQPIDCFSVHKQSDQSSPHSSCCCSTIDFSDSNVPEKSSPENEEIPSTIPADTDFECNGQCWWFSDQSSGIQQLEFSPLQFSATTPQWHRDLFAQGNRNEQLAKFVFIPKSHNLRQAMLCVWRN